MNYQTHIRGGLLAGVIASTAYQLPLMDAVALTLAGGLGGLIPDIDTNKSYIGRRLRITSTVFSKFLSHRGPTHYIPVQLMVYLIVSSITNAREPTSFLGIIWLGLFIGMVSHTVLDMFNPSGVAFLAPFFKKRISFANIYVNSTKETIFRVILTCILFINIYFYFTR